MYDVNRPSANGIPLDVSSAAFGELQDSSEFLADTEELRNRLNDDGYLFLRNVLDRNCLLSLQKEILQHVFGDFSFESLAYKSAAGFKDVRNAGRIPAVRDFVHNGPLIDICSNLFGSRARAFDYVWSRVVGAGQSETPHCDTVYMGRGTRKLFTAWTPLDDTPIQRGGLMILHKSHQLDKLNDYRALDVDRDRRRRAIVFKHGTIFRGFHYSKNPAKVQKELGLRWLTTNYRAGDVLLFSADTLHCAMDNKSDRFRVVLDARYQPASEPADSRYIGDVPVGHKRARIGVSVMARVRQLFKRPPLAGKPLFPRDAR